ncbi:MAG: M64 family metallo-endopeptidase [Anaerolineae bacterium]|nr:M64 family metallo-endopeptidase [Anaerolineae bacterium]NUQ06979.1 hypothetical protein [Anaerolineae bacterium]
MFYRQVMVDSAFFDPAGGTPGASRLNDRIRISLVQRDGSSVFETTADAPRWVRGEFHGAGGSTPGIGETIDGHFFASDRSAFVVRAPVLPETRLLLRDDEAGMTQTFDLQALAADSTLPLFAPAISRLSPLGALDGGPSANRVDLLIMGDGYPAGQESLFDTHVSAFAAGFFGITPYAEYRSYVKLASLFTPSPQSGADHPPYVPGCTYTDGTKPTCCADSDAASDALAGTFVTTAFDSTFCAYNIHRLLVGSGSKVLAAAAAYPDWDQIMLLVNDPTYGGSGGFFAVASMHAYAVEIAQHEYAHSFADLADEYESAYPGYPACSDTDGDAFNDCEANVTNQNVREQVKWRRWIDPATPVVTPPVFPYTDPAVTGLFLGARYQSANMYRPGYACIMRTLGYPYCAVASEAYALHLYDGGFGSPPQPGIENIEPDTPSPASASVTLAQCLSQTFSAQLLGPTGGDSLNVRWLVDGTPVDVSTAASGDIASYTYTPGAPGIVTLTLEVTDSSPILHDDVRAGTVSTISWTVEVSATPCVGAEVTATLQGRPPAPHSSYVLPLHVVLTPQGGGAPVLDDDFTADENGVLVLPAVPPGGYTLWVKGAHTLAVAQNVTLDAEPNAITTGVLKEGDADGGNQVNISDFSILASAFASGEGDPRFDARADFNSDGVVNIGDFSLLASNFGAVGAS